MAECRIPERRPAGLLVGADLPALQREDWLCIRDGLVHGQLQQEGQPNEDSVCIESMPQVAGGHAMVAL